jgi:cellulose synthase/poly-beta-1,6-N-acetylglucosamine synthase-like glycosyltransferase
MPDNRFGKKAGLALAIQEAKGEFILCTDADCEFDSKWISAMITSQQTHIARFVFGPVDISLNDTIFSRLQRMEFWGLIGSGAASLQLGVPSMCNGANLLFEKKAFNTVGGYVDIQRTATGDDVLLMMKLRERFPDSVVFCKSADAIVKTAPQLSIRDFFNQRSRWASKFSVYKAMGVKVIALVVFTSYLSILVAVPLIIYFKISILLFLSIMLVKLVVDYLFLRELQKFYKSKFDLMAFILLQFIMPLYVTFFGIIGRRKTFRWKDRTCN